jgi:GNAT superfamily N-acetyltransferase
MGPKRLSEDQIEAASEVAARAFQQDPLNKYYYPDSNERKIKNVLRCQNIILLGILSGEVYISSENVEGIAIWIPYKIKDYQARTPSKDIIRKLRRVKREVYSDRQISEKIATVTEIFNSLHLKYANFPHWHLTFLAVDPVYQGKGFASLLLNNKLQEIDKLLLPSYLDVQNKKNLSLYEHFGFELVGKKRIPNSDIYYHGMLRIKKKENE